MNTHLPTGIRLGLVACDACGLLSRGVTPDKPGYCPRCGEELTRRRRQAIQRTWALIIAAAISYIPANLLPVMVTNTLVSSEADTIMSGIVRLYETGSWFLALIVLIASVIIPLAKIAALAYLLITVQRRALGPLHEQARLYRLIEFVGRWSMLDVFVVTFVVALVQFQPLMWVQPGVGILFFAAVVLSTMLAAKVFDPRLIWDEVNEKDEGSHD